VPQIERIRDLADEDEGRCREKARGQSLLAGLVDHQRRPEHGKKRGEARIRLIL